MKDQAALPLLPAQAGFFIDIAYQLTNVSTFNLNSVLQLAYPVTLANVEEAVGSLWRRHGLRASFQHATGDWVQRVASPFSQAPFEAVDISAIPVEKQAQTIDSIGRELQYSLNIFDGPLVRFVWCWSGAETASELLIVVHHLACDAYSLQLIESELAEDLTNRAMGRPLRRRRPYSYDESVIALDRYARSAVVMDTLPVWLEQVRSPRGSAAIAEAAPSRSRVSNFEHVKLGFTENQTQTMFSEMRAEASAFRRDFILSTVARSLADHFDGELLMQVVQDGRTVHAPLGKRVPLTAPEALRAVGWFASESEVIAPATPEPDWKSYLDALRHRNRMFEDDGLSFSLLMHISAKQEIREALEAGMGPQVWFNHVSLSRSTSLLESSVVRRSPHRFTFPPGPVVDPQFSGTPLVIDIANEADDLSGTITFDTAFYNKSDIESLARRITSGAHQVGEE